MQENLKHIPQLQQQHFESAVSITTCYHDAIEKLSHLNLSLARKTLEDIGESLHGLMVPPGETKSAPDLRWQPLPILENLADYYRGLHEISRQTRIDISTALQQLR